MTRQELTPIFSGLLKHVGEQPVQFHIPGHKQGSGMAREFARFTGEGILSIDLINIAPLDDLHYPRGIIREAQELAAEAFGADYTFFSVQGTSCAIMAMILSVCGPGDKILLPRNIHKSVLSGIILAGAIPVFLAPDFDYEWGIAHGVHAETIDQALTRHPDAKAVLVVHPTYFGVATDLVHIVQLAHSRGVPVLVDEAHGVHSYFHDELPVSAMAAGADMAATSMHKLGGSLTQTSLLNMKRGLVDPRAVQKAMSMLTTTSTSYLLLASLDVARKQLATDGNRLIDQTLRLADKARTHIQTITGISCFAPDLVGPRSFDRTKLCISVTDLGMSGIEAEQLLRAEFRLEVELSDLHNILCVLSLGDRPEHVDTLIRALESLAARGKQPNRIGARRRLPAMPTMAVTPRDAFYAQSESLPLTEAEGRIIAESVMVYPPGIPLLLPGELVNAETISYILDCLQAGLLVQGMEETNCRVKVVSGNS